MSVPLYLARRQLHCQLLSLAYSPSSLPRVFITRSTFALPPLPTNTGRRAAMASQKRPSSSSASKAPIASPRPSSSVLLLSPTNDVLLLQRVSHSTSFASAYVFPGGNLDPLHDGVIPDPDSADRHRDGPSYRMGAIRECFEETGILLAKKDGKLVELDKEDRDRMRSKVHSGEVKFTDWLRDIGCEADVGGLVPFTRWVTPQHTPKRFTTQMYLYLLPISNSSLSVPSKFHIPTPDGGVEHTEALFASPRHFMQRAANKSPANPNPITLFPPQYFLLHLMSKFLTGGTDSLEDGPLHYTQQRKRLLKFIRAVPTAETEKGKAHPASQVSWGDKMICPNMILRRDEDGRTVMSLEKSGPEAKGQDRAGEWERVVLVRFSKAGPSEVEVRRREDVLEEERQRQKASEGKL